jgi:hypothetical protein
MRKWCGLSRVFLLRSQSISCRFCQSILFYLSITINEVKKSLEEVRYYGDLLITAYVCCNIRAKFQEYLEVRIIFGGAGTSVGIATGYGLDGPGIEFR